MAMTNALVIAREVETALASTTGRNLEDPRGAVELVEAYAPRLALAMELAATPDEANAVRAQADALHKFVRRVLPKVQSDRQERREAAFPAAWAYVAASRKAGALWNAVENKRERGRPIINVENSTFITVSQAGFVDRKDAQICSRIATLDEQDVDLYRQECQRAGEVPTLHGLYRVWRMAREPGETPDMPEGQFGVIYADPPWEYEFSETQSREIENHYPVMALGEICALPVARLAADDCVLFLWATSPKLEDGLEVLKAWTFSYRTCMVWVKDKIGMGYYARQRHELLLIGARGQPRVPQPADRPDSVISAPRREHSQKPAVVYELIERMYPAAPRIELFARSQRAGWQAWGNQV